VSTSPATSPPVRVRRRNLDATRQVRLPPSAQNIALGWFKHEEITRSNRGGGSSTAPSPSQTPTHGAMAMATASLFPHSPSAAVEEHVAASKPPHWPFD
jgi:hypothetical protein